MRLGRKTGFLVVLGLGLAPACDALTDTDTSALLTAAGEPIVEIDPATFLKTCVPGTDGDGCPEIAVPCANLPGAMQSYVVTFTDEGPVGYEGAGFPLILPSSPPTPCSQPVSFNHGITGHRYTAEIDGYEQRPSDIVPACSTRAAYARCADDTAVAPLGNGTCVTDSDCFANGCFGRCAETTRQQFNDTLGVCTNSTTNPGTTKVCDYEAVPGDRHMVVPGEWTPVRPRWTTRTGTPCGYHNLIPVSAFERVPITPCEPLDDRGGDVLTGVLVRPAATLGSLACYAEMEIPNPDLADAGADGGDAGPATITVSTGTITKLDVVPVDPKIEAKKGLACGTVDGVAFTDGIAPGVEYTFNVFGYDKTHLSPTYRASCVATALDGIEVVAKCVPLTPISPN